MRSSVGDAPSVPGLQLYRDDKVSFWKLEATDEVWNLKPYYIRALPLYLNGLDSIFARAQQQDEAQLILSLLGIKGLQAAGWDPYDTTIDAIQAATPPAVPAAQGALEPPPGLGHVGLAHQGGRPLVRAVSRGDTHAVQRVGDVFERLAILKQRPDLFPPVVIPLIALRVGQSNILGN